MRSARLPLLLALASFSAALFSCGASHRPALAGATEPAAEADLLAPDAHPLDVTSTTLANEDVAALLDRCIADSDCTSRERCEAGRCAMAEDQCDALPIVYFGFDESSLSADARKAARLLARCIKERALPSVSVEAFADERGATEYNLALSYQRASALRAELVREGVTARVSVVAWGEAFPAARGHDEAAWAENRRAVATTAGQLLSDQRYRASR